MREIKFRAWDKDANIMVYSDHRARKLYDVYYGFEMNSKGELECNWEGEFTESHVLDGGILDNIMQWTGLTDNNGIEIYEGDIVKATYYDLTHGSTGVVRFDNGSFYIDCDGLSLYTWFDYEIEVLGNIFENKELLKEKI